MIITVVLISLLRCVLAFVAKCVVNWSRVCGAGGAGESKPGESERLSKIKATFDHLWTWKQPVYVAVCVTTGELSRFLTKEFELKALKPRPL